MVTGSEALYNDLGHFGRKPIQTAWLYLVLPALLLNYFGQGALVLADPETIAESVLSAVPGLGALPDGGAGHRGHRHRQPGGDHRRLFASPARRCSSASCRAWRSGTPRSSQAGQIYMPRVNWLLLTGVLLLVFMFRSSSELAAAYVLAVATTEWTAGVLGFIVIWKLWRWPLWAAAGADGSTHPYRHRPL